MGCGIWGRVVLKWTYGAGMGEYGAQGLMGLYGMWDLGSGGPKVDIWVTGMNGALWDLRYGVGWP